uniref:SLATT domain-containing protein n=1 Tax=Caenorhabditis tropicalis TaxID=1561998 RepID=A0A1I7U2J5_9PELO
MVNHYLDKHSKLYFVPATVEVIAAGVVLIFASFYPSVVHEYSSRVCWYSIIFKLISTILMTIRQIDTESTAHRRLMARRKDMKETINRIRKIKVELKEIDEILAKNGFKVDKDLEARHIRNHLKETLTEEDTPKFYEDLNMLWNCSRGFNIKSEKAE